MDLCVHMPTLDISRVAVSLFHSVGKKRVVDQAFYRLPNALAHLAYINTLPRPEQLSTPLHFNTAELDAFKGTNLYGATVDRERNWKEEWEECLSIVFICLAKDRSNEFTW